MTFTNKVFSIIKADIIFISVIFLLISCNQAKDKKNHETKVIDDMVLNRIDEAVFKLDSITHIDFKTTYFDKTNNSLSFVNSFDNSVVYLDFDDIKVKKEVYAQQGPNEVLLYDGMPVGHALLNDGSIFLEESKFYITIFNQTQEKIKTIDIRNHPTQNEPFQTFLFSFEYRPIVLNNTIYYSNAFKNFNDNGYNKPIVELDYTNVKFNNHGEFPDDYKNSYYGSLYALASFISYNENKQQFIVSYAKTPIIHVYDDDFNLLKEVKSEIKELGKIEPYSEDTSLYYQDISSDEWRKIGNRTIRFQNTYKNIFYDSASKTYCRIALEMPKEDEGYYGVKSIYIQVLNDKFHQIALKKLNGNLYDYRSIFVNQGKIYILNKSKMKDDNHLYFDIYKIRDKQ